MPPRRLLPARRSMVDGMQAAALPPPSAAPPSGAELAAFARQQWEALLLYLVDGASSPPSPPHVLRAAALDVPGLLAAAGLMLKNEYTQRQSECAGRVCWGGGWRTWDGPGGWVCECRPAGEQGWPLLGARATAPRHPAGL